MMMILPVSREETVATGMDAIHTASTTGCLVPKHTLQRTFFVLLVPKPTNQPTIAVDRLRARETLLF